MSTEVIEVNSSLELAQASAQASDMSALIRVIERVAMNPDVDITKLEKMLDMQERIFNREAEQSFNTSMAHAQSEMGRVSADATNPQTRSRYASYAALDRAIRPVYTQHGFALSFNTEPTSDGYVRVVCIVSHKDGHSRKYSTDMPADGMGAKGGAVMTKTHAAGAAMSYGQRYLLKLIFNVAVGEDDDDGNGASAPRQTGGHERDVKRLPDYPDASLKDFTQAWKTAIDEGKTTPERIIHMISSKHVLSEDQKRTIRALASGDSTDGFVNDMKRTEQEMTYANA